MQSSELKENLDRLAPHYEQGKFWEQYVLRCGRYIAPKVDGQVVLEMGCSSLVLSKVLFKTVKRLDIVEGSQTFVLAGEKHFNGAVKFYHQLFHEFNPPCRYDGIVFTNTLHHVFNPEETLIRAKGWLAPGGTLYLTAPNMNSLHRQIGVEMGLISDLHAESDRNRLFKQPGRYTMETLVSLCEKCGYTIRKKSAFFVKPFSDSQMSQLNPAAELIDALFTIGQKHQEIASMLYLELSN